MSLAMPRMPVASSERASVVLPTVKCSSCSVAIPLNSLSDHVCQGPPPMPALPHTSVKVPPIITKESSPPLAQRPFVSTGLQRPNAPEALLPRNTRPFLIGEVVPSARLGDYPADVPLSAVSESSMGRWPIGDNAPAGHVLPSPTLPDTTSGGFAGMAGVGRRAFAAAAWSVRAGVALAAGAHAHHGSGYSSPSERDGSISMPMPNPSRSPSSAETTPDRSSPPRFSPPQERPGSSRHHHQPSSSSRSATPREPVILPKAPLSGRQRSNTIRDANRSESRADDYRSPSRMAEFPVPSRPQLDQRSASAMSHRERERSDEPSPFFEKYKQTMGSKSDQTHMSSSTRWNKDDDETSIDSQDEDSQLPWVMSPEQPAVPLHRFDHQRNPTDGSIASASSSSQSCGPPELRSRNGSGHEELVMTPNQSWEGLADRSGALEVMKKPFENPGLGLGDSLAQIGEEEEDDDEEEGEAFVIGTPQNSRRAKPAPPNLARSNSESTVTQTASPQRSMTAPQFPTPYRTHDMEPPRMGMPLSSSTSSSMRTRQGDASSSSNGSPTDNRRPKRVCVSCGNAVGGSRRFVERDGVILCEADWKKLYLPSCRRCEQPIEKSAVSSSDGQLKGKWHRACFTCSRCDRPFDGDDFYVHDGRPWCQYHYAEENGTLCAASSCGKPIEGPCILAPGSSNGLKDQRFHPGHLRCEHRGGASGSQNCRESMNEYYEVGGGRYCERHAAEAARRLASSGGRAEKRRTRLVDLGLGGLAGVQTQSNGASGGNGAARV